MADVFVTPPPTVENTLQSLGVPPPKKKNNLLIAVLVIAVLLVGGGIIFLTSQLSQFRGDNRQRAFDTTTTGTLACGQACTSDSQCRNPSANGGPVGCRGGVCENLACPTGKTIPGANCDCSVAARTCGQTCGASVGLCGDGRSTCRFLSGSACTGNEFSAQSVCVPNTLPAGWALTKCADNGNSYTTKNGQNPTQADVQAICNPQTTCYRCTAALTDGNACESFTVSDPTCPAGSSATADACASAATGGACPATTPTPTPTLNAASTPTATPTPTATATVTVTTAPTPTTTIQTTPTTRITSTPTPTRLPDAGNELPTLTVFGGGILLLILGVALSL